MDSLADGRDNQEEMLLQREEQSLRSSHVRQAMGRLNERERRIVHDRILSDQPRTLQDRITSYNVCYTKLLRPRSRWEA